MPIPRVLFWLLLVVLLPFRSALAQEITTGSRGHAPHKTRPALSEAQREEIWTRIRSNHAALQKSGTLPSDASTSALTPPTLILPLAPKAGYADPGFFAISGFVDHDPAVPDQLLDYDCGVRTYDLIDPYNHSGTDYYLWPFAWDLMDSDSVEIVAAAAGTILGKDDPVGNYDRNCDWDNILGLGWNAVYIEHADGSVAWYGHMKNGSTTPKAVGMAVAQGEKIGLVGSSGFSDYPHLHFELYADIDETILIDPYAGACNSTTATSWWASQPPYRDSQINRLMTASGGPTWPEDYCSNDPDLAKDVFLPNDPIYFTALYRDELIGQTSVFTVYRPDDSVFATYNHTATETPFYGDSFVTISDTIPASPQNGTWRVEVDYEGEIYSHNFQVSVPSDFDGDGVFDTVDNCSEAFNPGQDDSDGDDCGNLCDADYDDSGIVGHPDVFEFSANFASGNQEYCHDEPIPGCLVGFPDLAFLISEFGNPAGPSGTTAGTTACP